MLNSDIHLYILNNDLESLKKELEQNPQSLNFSPPNLLQTPLFTAARNGSLDAVKFLLDKNANIYAKNGLGQTLLDVVLIRLLAEEHIAIHQKLIIILERLLKHERNLLSKQNPALLDIKGAHSSSSREMLKNNANNSNHTIISKLFEKYSDLESASPTLKASPKGVRHRYPPTITAAINPGDPSPAASYSQKAFSFLPAFLIKNFYDNPNHPNDEKTPIL